MQFHYENKGVFKDSDFLTVVVLAHHLITRSLEKSVENHCPRCPTTLPNHSPKSLASWKRLCDGFGRILVSQITFQRSPLRVPGASKNVFFQAWAPRKPSESMLEPICTPREWNLDIFWMLFGLQNLVQRLFVPSVLNCMSPCSKCFETEDWSRMVSESRSKRRPG